MTTSKINRVRVHRDSTITYWSVYRQAWVLRAAYVPSHEITAMPVNRRAAVVRALATNPWYPTLSY